MRSPLDKHIYAKVYLTSPDHLSCSTNTSQPAAQIGGSEPMVDHRPSSRRPPSSWKEDPVPHVLLVLLLVLIVLIGVSIWRAFAGLAPQVAAALVAGITTVLASVLTPVVSKQWERRRQVQQEQREHKLRLYKEFLEFWLRVVVGDKTGVAEVSEKETLDFQTTFTQKLILWGADDVVRKCAQFAKSFASSETQPTHAQPEQLERFGELLAAVRLDVGHKNQDLEPADLLALLVTHSDIRPHLAQPG